MQVFKPTATYRVQLHKDFNFKALKKIIPYLNSLGIDTIYASPIFKAISGSQHGYDGVSPLEINPEIGTEEELVELSEILKQNNMFWLQDIVPNHMAFSPENEWLMDVLENGKKSEFYHYFDINFPNDIEDKRLMVPFLGECLEDAINERKISIVAKEKKLFLAYGDSNWPINEKSYDFIFGQKNGKKYFFDNFNGTKKGNPVSKKLDLLNQDLTFLNELTGLQFYRLCDWQETTKKLNYRRFFTVNDLICLNIEHEDVFDHYHKYIVELVKKDVFQGLRIDHIDGLAHPEIYLERLRQVVGEDIYISVEKILAVDEQLPNNWSTQGDTGYDFLQLANNVLTNTTAESELTKFYKQYIKEDISPSELVPKKKKNILNEQMGGELANLRKLFEDLDFGNHKKLSALTAKDLETAIGELLVHCPVYRFYDTKFPLTKNAKTALAHTFKKAKEHSSNKSALSFLETSLFKETTDKAILKNRSIFYNRCMQFSGPLMAKGVEDTLMYNYNRLLAHNEVGDSLNRFGISIKHYHREMHKRYANFPYAMNATATHDTKRGEDTRARLIALAQNSERWQRLVAALDELIDTPTIHPNDAYFVYQTLIGTLPLDDKDFKQFKIRVQEYLEKVLREAKRRSDWAKPDSNYEELVKRFATSLIQPISKSDKLHQVLSDIEDEGLFNAVLQTVLKLTSPGIPDIYQGTELWDFSLVDPDNRRPVDYNLRSKLLKNFSKTHNLSHLWESRTTGEIKLWLTKQLLTIRKTNKSLFEDGKYIPVKVRGKLKKHVLSFLREYEGEKILVVLPLGLGAVEDLLKTDWRNTALQLNSTHLGEWKNLLSPEEDNVFVLNQKIKLSDLFDGFPIAILQLQSHKGSRGSGVFLPVTSLSSDQEVGSMGPEAYKFIDFLHQTKQRYWQLLPHNPVGRGNAYSPYSSSSSMAGSTLLISPKLLFEKGWLAEKDLVHNPQINAEINYQEAERLQKQYLAKAYENYKKSSSVYLKLFEDFCAKEFSWLDDFALFTLISQHHQEKQWSEWPAELKVRQEKAIKRFSKENAEKLNEIKWQQFVFDLQWKELQAYAKKYGVKFIGDLPIYISYHSADVWANPNLFKLDDKLTAEVVSGVPPDAFSDDGQLWGMPIFNWDEMKKDGYQWWMQRIGKNLAHFDLIRLDHFRAFHTYWEIPATEKTAKNGVWKKGPGKHFFNAVYKTFGSLPFIAEDLGAEMEEALAFREELGLPGMKVLQFGFGKNLINSEHTLHNHENENYAVYTGTHDNDTIIGWYKSLEKEDKKRLKAYFGHKVTKRNIHFVMNRLALSSYANIAILQAQDLIGLDSDARLNTPGTIEGNWVWRIKPGQLNEDVRQWLTRNTVIFRRS